MFDVMKILYHFWQARKLAKQLTTREKLHQYQQERLQYFIDNTLGKSPFYRQYQYKSLKDIPIIDKSVFLKSFDRINIVGITLNEALRVARNAEEKRDFSSTWNDITIGLSSGTSGKENIFMASTEERLRWAGIMLEKALPGSIMGSYKIAFFLRANSNLYTTLRQSKRIRFEFFDLMQSVDGNLKRLNHLQPNILTAPASVLTLIAKAQKDKIINIKPDKIFSVAEVLEPDDQQYIEEVFEQKLHQIYQCTEGFLGITNNQGDLYLNEEYLYIEKE
ncbi:MAG: F390 synthetase-related protein, partial [Pseudomonadota bacterium]